MDLAQRRWEEQQERINKLAAEGMATEEVSRSPALHGIAHHCAMPSLRCIAIFLVSLDCGANF